MTGRGQLIELAKAWERGGRRIAGSAATIALVAGQQQAQRVLGFPDGYRAVYLIGLGCPADRPLRPVSRPNRRPFDEVVRWNH